MVLAELLPTEEGPDHTPYHAPEAKRKSKSYSTYSDLPHNLAQQTAQNTNYNRTPPPRQLDARPKNSLYPYNSSTHHPTNPEQARLQPKKPFIPKNRIYTILVTTIPSQLYPPSQQPSQHPPLPKTLFT